MGSKSRPKIMKANQYLKNGTAQKEQKKENAPDIISRPFFNSCPKGSDSVISNFLNFSIMNNLRNKLQLIGNVGQDPELTTLESGRKVTRFSLATNANYKNAKGEKVQRTDWHYMVAWGKAAEIIEKYAGKGKEIAIEGKLASRSYETNEGGNSERAARECDVTKFDRFSES